jgi:TPR repeat protein
MKKLAMALCLVTFAIVAYAQSNEDSKIQEDIKKAYMGDLVSQLTLGNLYGYSNDYNDPKQAEKYFLMAAAQDNIGAQLSLADLYASGHINPESSKYENVVTGCAWRYIAGQSKCDEGLPRELAEEMMKKISLLKKEYPKITIRAMPQF